MKLIRIIFTALFLFTFQISASVAEDEIKSAAELATPFIEAFKANDRNAIAKLVKYPLKRDLPIPSIKNESELITRFEQVFDDELTQIIVTSNPQTDWEKMGFRGVMLNNGIVWLDSNGNFLGANYQSKAEASIKLQLINAQKESLHENLKEFKEPSLEWLTERFHIRVDNMGDSYRYAAWSINKPTSEQPDLVIQNGTTTADGTGGNYHFTFKNGEYLYELNVNVLRARDTPIGRLSVYKGDEVLVNEVVVKDLNDR